MRQPVLTLTDGFVGFEPNEHKENEENVQQWLLIVAGGAPLLAQRNQIWARNWPIPFRKWFLIAFSITDVNVERRISIYQFRLKSE